MKKVFYFLLLIAEAFFGACLMSSFLLSSLYIPFAIAIALVVGLLVWQIYSLSKANDAKAKRKIYRNILLIMLIPGVVFVLTFFALMIGFIIMFA